MRISFTGGKKAKIRHNTREFISANVDKSRCKDNIIIVNQTVPEAYEKLFGEPQRKYNAKQKRKDSAGILTNPENAQIVTECLQEYAEGFQERNSYLCLFNAIIHLDEHTPHLHLDFIPFAEGYKKGMERQLSIAKTLEAMGYDKNSDNAIRDFNANERKIFREICERHGLEIEKEEKSREITFTPQQMRDGISEQYAELKKTEKSLNEKKSAFQETEKSLQEKQSALSEVTSQLQTATATVNDLQEQEQELKEKVDEAIDLVRKFTPSPTKIVKRPFGKEKEETKTIEELQNEKLIITARELLTQREKILSEATQQSRLVVSSAEATAQQIISEAENSEIVLRAKAEAEQVIQSANDILHEAEITKASADNYCKERVALADEEVKEREAHISALAELSKPTAEYEESMQWLYGMSVRHKAENLVEETENELEEDFEFDEEEIEEPDFEFEF